MVKIIYFDKMFVLSLKPFAGTGATEKFLERFVA